MEDERGRAFGLVHGGLLKRGRKGAWGYERTKLKLAFISVLSLTINVSGGWALTGLPLVLSRREDTTGRTDTHPHPVRFPCVA